MSEAGPSRPRQSNGNGNGNAHTQSNGTPNGRADRDRDDEPSRSPVKRRKITDAKELFAKPSVEDQLRLSRGYRALQADAEEMRADVENLTAAKLARAVGKQNELFADVNDTAIGTLDANLIKTNTENAMAFAKRFKVDGVSFNIDEFLSRLQGTLGLNLAELGDQDLSSDDELEESGRQRPARKGVLGDWDKIGWMAAVLCRRVPGVEFMYGPLSVTHKKRQMAPRQKKTVVAPEVRPEEVKNQAGEKKAKDDFTSNVKMVLKVLSKLDQEGEGINLFHLVVNPDDYGQTVENLFFVSFLLNQGLAGISVNKDDGEIIIRRTEAHDAESGEEPIKNQAVVELDLATWELAKKVHGITKSAIPHRDYTAVRNQMAGNAWYS